MSDNSMPTPEKPDLGVWFVWTESDVEAAQADASDVPRIYEWRMYPQCHELLARRWAATTVRPSRIQFVPFTLTVGEAAEMTASEVLRIVDKVAG